ncbi:hypothetical protein L226DRAFT_170807 [Lentinus tigrinus ALCF2SS1-7]|uniref:uncharacterized protein n=1 Tax=Lentinus tigrinus ALCF2SS1-7 TaxID=1328758 RepID=UPI00116638E5|nr:hypothetical protein L226DRAFT_170807 [Lentinus tigrinus ALCF2SS1-7]
MLETGSKDSPTAAACMCLVVATLLAWIVLSNRASAVQYSQDNWHQSEATTYGMTTGETCAESPGTASINYDFWSVDVWAFYWPATDIAQVTCTLDGDPLEVRRPPNTTSNPHTVWHWLVCGAANLAWKNHTVEISVTDASQTKPFCLDRFDIVTSHSSQAVKGGLTSSSTPGANTMEKKASVGAIVGGTIGGILLLLLICGSIFLWWRHRKEQHRYIRTFDGDHDFDRRSTRENTIQSFFRRTLGLDKPRRRAASWVEPVRPAVHQVSLLPGRLHPIPSLHHGVHPEDLHHTRSLPPETDEKSTSQDLELMNPLPSEKGERGSLISPRLPRSESPQPLQVPDATSPHPTSTSPTFSVPSLR